MCTFISWILNSFFCAKPFPHSGHRTALSSSRVCFLMMWPSNSVTFVLQIVHNFFSFECESMCALRVFFDLHSFPHMWQGSLRLGLWLATWLLHVWLFTSFPQISHVLTLDPSWYFRCFSRYSLCVYFFPQMWQWWKTHECTLSSASDIIVLHFLHLTCPLTSKWTALICLSKLNFSFVSKEQISQKSRSGGFFSFAIRCSSHLFRLLIFSSS